MDFQICKCGRALPLTEEFWPRNKNTASGFTSKCRICTKLYQSTEQRLLRAKRREDRAIESLNENEVEQFHDFDRRALADKIKLAKKPVISIFREI
jgi:hypothetical protein